MTRFGNREANKMARHELTIREKLRGLSRAINTLKRKRRGPTWLLPSIREYRKRLLRELGAKRKIDSDQT
jgi:hypothetical protein